ncbi:trans-sialidase, putative [Trypanosoma cruzi]|nr:trans-sialidase, putative [Trypanosoma cruzi]
MEDGTLVFPLMAMSEKMMAFYP